MLGIDEAWPKSNEIQIGHQKETIFLWKIAKSRPFEGKGFLNNYVFSITNKESPLMKDDLGSVWGPTKRLQKKIEKKKSKVKSREIMPTAIHTHGSLHAMTAANSKNQPDGQSPAHTNSMQKINKSQFRTCKLQKHSPGTGTETCKQAWEESCRKFKAKQHTSQPA